MTENTRDLMQFGYRELREAAKLLNAFTETNKSGLNDNVAIELNPSSGNVFLVDEDYNVAMMNGDKLEQWYSCPYCGHEGFKEDMQHEPENKECLDYLKEIEAITQEEYIEQEVAMEL